MLCPRRLFVSVTLVMMVVANLYVLHLMLTTTRSRVSRGFGDYNYVKGDFPILSGIISHIKAEPERPARYETATTLHKRLEALRHECDFRNMSKPLDFKNLPRFSWPWIYVSRKYKLLYCQIPKVGTTNWLKIFAKLQMKVDPESKVEEINNAHNIKLELLSYLRPAERDEVLRDYTKFLVVRDPFERVLSAFKDKLEWRRELKGPIFRKLASTIVDRYRKKGNLTNDGFNRITKVPRFEEFLRFVVDPSSTDVEMHYSEPRHWLPQHKLCYPCNIDYDYLLRIDNISDEADFLLNEVGIPDKVRYPNSTSKSPYNEMLPAYFSNVSPDVVNALYHYYELDYRLFGFDVPPQF
uniref:Carbohydrate sulfotransferase n=1 Tax=Phallusia mammillata TaxID=59560 RepID=A0A6F9D9Y2_9ASCI|nr:carbohydrate sulfotransferase 8 [Phallusia mammillata]